MDFNEFKILAKGMKAVYTQQWFLPDTDAVKIWYELLKDLDYAVANIAIQKYMHTNKKEPTVADIRELATAIQIGEKPQWSDGWEQVRSNIRKYGMCSYDSNRLAECMNSFDPLTRRVVERLGWRELCNSKDSDVMADRANFRMIYEQIAEREHTAKQLPMGLTQLIESARIKHNLLESKE